MTDLKFEDLSKKTVAQLRKIAEGTEHQALQDPAKMPKQELLTALCQALGIEAGEPPEESVKDETPAAQESVAAEAAQESPEDKEPVLPQEGKATEPPEESVKDETPAAQESAAAEATQESPEDKDPVPQEGKATEPPEESVKDQEPPTQKSKDKPAKKSAKDQNPPQEPALPASVNKDKSKFKVQLRELKSQRDAALEAHDHVQLKAIRRRIRSLKRKVRRIAV